MYVLSFRQKTKRNKRSYYSLFVVEIQNKLSSDDKNALLFEKRERRVEERQMRVYLKCFCGGGGAFLSFYCAALN